MGVMYGRRIASVCYLRLNELTSHQFLIALLEKGMDTEICFLDHAQDFQKNHFHAISPYGLTPFLQDREVCLYSLPILIEFLEERYPHPPFLPIYPILRAKTRLMAYRIQQDWYPYFEKFNCLEKMPPADALKPVVEGISQIAGVFENTTYLGSEEFSILDLAILPVLWRLSLSKSSWSILPGVIKDYAERLFVRRSMLTSVDLLKHHTFFSKEA